MGALDNLISGPRAQDAFLLRMAMEPPWSMSAEDEAPLTIVAQLEGHSLFARFAFEGPSHFG